MLLLGTALIALGVSDSTRSLAGERGTRWRATSALLVGSGVGMLTLFLAGAGAWMVVGFGVVSLPGLWLWGELRNWTQSGGTTRSRWAMAYLTTVVLALVVVAPWLPAPESSNEIASWMVDAPYEIVRDVSSEEAVLVVGVLLCQVATGNAVVRVLLTATGIAIRGNQSHLRGGRVIGPMERILIVGFVLGGEPAGAALIVAAKSIIRFPEVSHPAEGTTVPELSEYFLVGSFVSWIVALAPTILLNGVV